MSANAMTITPAEIKELRRKRDWTQQDLADELHVSRDTVASWETGRQNPLGPAEILLRKLSENSEAATA